MAGLDIAYQNSNTTLVKVKLELPKRLELSTYIQIQHLLKLNYYRQ